MNLCGYWVEVAPRGSSLYFIETTGSVACQTGMQAAYGLGIPMCFMDAVTNQDRSDLMMIIMIYWTSCKKERNVIKEQCIFLTFEVLLCTALNINFYCYSSHLQPTHCPAWFAERQWPCKVRRPVTVAPPHPSGFSLQTKNKPYTFQTCIKNTLLVLGHFAQLGDITTNVSSFDYSLPFLMPWFYLGMILISWYDSNAATNTFYKLIYYNHRPIFNGQRLSDVSLRFVKSWTEANRVVPTTAILDMPHNALKIHTIGEGVELRLGLWGCWWW